MLRGGLIALILLPIAGAVARDNGQYATVDPAIRHWYETRELTPAARARFGFVSCCAKSDVVKTRFRVDRRSGADKWQWMRGGVWVDVPPDIIHWDEHAPGGQAVLFAVPNGEPTCFFPPGGGI